MNEPKADKSTKTSSSRGLRQWILIGLLLLVLAAFLYDKYVLMPSAQAKIDQIENEVTRKISDQNRTQVHDIVGRQPTSTFTYDGIEVEQYRFPRGLPFYPRPVLDIAYRGDAIAFYRITDPIDKSYIDSQNPKTEIDTSLREDTGEPQIMGAGG